MMSIEKRTSIMGAVISVLLWILLVICGLKLNINPPHKDYKVIKISLENPSPVAKPVTPEQKQKQNAPVKKSSAKQAVQEQSNTSVPVQKNEQTSTVKKAETKIRKSMEEMIAENLAKSSAKKQSQDFESMFADDDGWNAASSVNQTASKTGAVSESGFEGSAASKSLASQTSSSASSASSSSTSKATSSSTSSLLSRVADTAFVQPAAGSNGVSSKVEIETAKTLTGNYAISMVDGKTRELIYPKSPVINISAGSAALIDSEREVTIVFRVNADGTVPRSNISFIPDSALPSVIKDEIRDQVMSWKFMEAASNGQAMFDYSIMVK